MRIPTAIASLFFLLACTVRQGPSTLTTNDVVFSMGYICPAPETIGRQLMFFRGGWLQTASSGVSKWYMLAPADRRRILEIVNSPAFRAAIEKQKGMPPVFPNGEQLMFSFERPAYLGEIDYPVFFRLDTPVPSMVSKLLQALNAALAHNNGEAFVEQWKSGDA